jgi:hypothetical protein
LVVLDSLSLFLTGQEEKETSFFVLVHSSCPAHSSASNVFPVDLQGCVLHVVLSTGQPPLVLLVRCLPLDHQLHVFDLPVWIVAGEMAV